MAYIVKDITGEQYLKEYQEGQFLLSNKPKECAFFNSIDEAKQACNSSSRQTNNFLILEVYQRE